jgi:uncharacterized protein
MPRRAHRRYEPPPVLWDAAIVLLIALPTLVAIHGGDLLGGSAWVRAIRTAAAICALLVAYGSFVEPRLLRVRKQRVALPVGAPLRLAVAADFHVGPYKGAGFVERVVAHINALKPDVILLPGDFIEGITSTMADLSPLKELRAPLGIFATLGNHDSGEMLTLLEHKPLKLIDRSAEVTETLRALGVTVLRNERVILRHGDRQIAIAGADDAWMDSCDLKKTLADIPPAAPTILLAHNPDVIEDDESRMADLIICGHTHGGQFRLPLIGPIVPIPNRVGRKYDWGLFKLENGTRMIVTCGVGESLCRARLFCPPEVVLVEVG